MFARWMFLGLPYGAPVRSSGRSDVLDAAIRSFERPGLWLEFGVYEAQSLNYIARRTGQHLFGFDSFEGLPTRWTRSYPAKVFSTHGKLPTVEPNVTLVKGLFDRTLPPFLDAHPEEIVAFLHVDSDLYVSAKTVLTLLNHRITRGSVIVFDEFCAGLYPDDEARAWREFSRGRAIEFRWLGCSIAGSVALQVTAGGCR
jgi:hypothetical protein